MKLSKRITWLRYVIYLYIVILGLSAIGQLLLGGILLWDHIAFNSLVENGFWKPAATLMAIGLANLILCWLGWSSTTKKKRCSIILFSVLIIASVGIQIYICIWSVNLRRTLLKAGSAHFEFALDTSFEMFFEQFKYETNHIWNRIQEEYKCCGVDGSVNYRHGSAIPWSCFYRSGNTVADANLDAIGLSPSPSLKIFERGCLEVLSTLLRRHLLYCALGTLISAVVQSIGLFCTIQLVLLLRREATTENVDMTSMSFRQKLETELQKPLSERRTLNRKPAFNGEGSTRADLS